MTPQQLKEELTLVLLKVEDAYEDTRELIGAEYSKDAKDVNLELIRKLKKISKELEKVL